MNTANSWINRQEKLRQLVRQRYECATGKIVLFANLEWEKHRFRQESSFYYFTGLEEPGVVVVFDLATDEVTLYIPDYTVARADWMYNPITLHSDLSAHGITEIAYLGNKSSGYNLSLATPLSVYSHLLQMLSDTVARKGHMFTLFPPRDHAYVEQQILLERCMQSVPGLAGRVTDISDSVAQMRRTKDTEEIAFLQAAIDVTIKAQRAAAARIQDGVNEAEVHAALEQVMIAHQMQPAFTSIVGSGHFSTVLHYHANNNQMHAGDLVVVDIGAANHNYCADITRTYPISGSFMPRQKELYAIVLETQNYIAQIAQPGYWLKNPQQPTKSLHHLACAFLRDRGLEKYFLHGIGHYLGLDVHDVGDYTTPLAPGDVITIEPGLYLPKERIGIRIEDNYLITPIGVVCLSAQLEKSIEAIESLLQHKTQQTMRLY